MKIVIENCENQIGAQSLETMANVLSLVGDEFLNEVESKVSPLLVAIFLKYSNGNDFILNLNDYFLYCIISDPILIASGTERL